MAPIGDKDFGVAGDIGDGGWAAGFVGGGPVGAGAAVEEDAEPDVG